MGSSSRTGVGLWLAGWLMMAAGGTAYGWTGAPGPHDGAHLVVVWADGFRAAGGQSVQTAKDALSVGGSGWRPAPGDSAGQSFTIRHAGDYALWLRTDRAKPDGLPLRVEVRQAETVLLAGEIGQGAGSVETGGPAGLDAFVKACVAQTADGAAIARVRGYAVGGAPALETRGGGGVEDDLVAELRRDLTTAAGGGGFFDANRLDPYDARRPFYWWKAGRARLAPGRYTLHIQAPAAGAGRTAPLLDMAFLSTATDADTGYPVAGDFTRQPGSYVRFRLDTLPEKGLTIQGRMATHYDPFSAGPWLFNPDGFPGEGGAAAAHRAAGYTRWYRLQDSGGEKAPGYGGQEVRFDITLSDGQARGATQFAGFPHGDYVVREFDWQEPDGRHLSMRMNFDRAPEHLRTIRDHSRENYERALRATQERLFPLTPTDDQTFSNVAGGGFGAAQDYEYKVLRLFGVNVPGVSDGPTYQRLYGGDLLGGHYWPPVFMPYDEESARTRYAAHYREYNKGNLNPHTRVFQLADEPGEINSGLSAPYWRHVKDGAGERYIDESEGSEWRSASTNLKDYVVEGIIQAGSLTIRVGQDASRSPAAFGFWTVGQVDRNTPINLRFGRGPTAGPRTATLPVCQLAGNGPTRFRVVHEGARAMLFVDDKSTAMIEGIPAVGAVSLVMGGNGQIRDLRIRRLRDVERLGAGAATTGMDLLTGGGSGSDGVAETLDDLLAEQAGEDQPMTLKEAMERDWIVAGGNPEAQAGFRRWAATRGADPTWFGKTDWPAVTLLTLRHLVETPEQKRLYYWSRRYSSWLTPKMFSMAAEALHAAAPNQKLQSFVALSGHALYMGSTAMPLDMFELARLGESTHMMPGVSDAMSYGSWRWDSHQSVAYSVAPYNAGGRVTGRRRRTYPMMHCDWPSELRAYTMLGNQCKYISYFWYGPQWAITEWYWADGEGSYHAVSRTCNRTALAADIIGPAEMRPSRVAMLYAHATEYWSGASSYADKRALFMGLSHDYFQPELVTEEQVAGEGALEAYRALYVTEPHVRRDVLDRIGDWVRRGGLLWVCADALRADEYDEPLDFLERLTGLERTYRTNLAATAVMRPADDGPVFDPHPVAARATETVAWPGARVRAVYDDGRPAWLEKAVGQGRVVFLGHRGGLTYSRRAFVPGGMENVWTEAPRIPLTLPLIEAGVERDMVLSRHTVAAYPISASNGTAILLFNYNPYDMENLAFRLRERDRPLRVSVFKGFDLEPIPFEWEAGELRFTLPRLGWNESQMVIVRTREAGPDDRPAEMLANTKRNLADADWKARSAGAWFAGFFPDWNLAGSLIPLLKDPHHAVRRAALESLGRLKAVSAADAVRAVATAETDPHTLAEALMTAGRLGGPGAAAFCRSYAGHAQVMVRRGALRGMRYLLDSENGDGDTAIRAEARGLAEALLDDPDARIFEPALDLYSRLDPAGGLRLTLDALASRGPGAARADDWVDTATRRQDVLEAWLAADMPEKSRLFMLFASRHDHPALTALVLAEPETVSSQWSFLRWTNRADAMRLFAARERLPKNVQPYVYVLLTRVFERHLGADASAWAGFLAGSEAQGQEKK